MFLSFTLRVSFSKNIPGRIPHLQVLRLRVALQDAGLARAADLEAVPADVRGREGSHPPFTAPANQADY